MARTTDEDSAFLTAADLCKLAGIKHPRRAKWADDGHVRKAAAGQNYGFEDVAEIVGFTEMVRALEYENAVLAWADVRRGLRGSIREEGRALVLFDERRRVGHFLSDLTMVGEAMEIGNPSVLLDLTDVVAGAMETCRRLYQARSRRAAANKAGVKRARHLKQVVPPVS